MKISKAIALGIVAYLAIRFFVKVAEDRQDGDLDKPLHEHAKDTVAEVFVFVGTALGLAIQPKKWNTAKDVLLSGSDDGNYADVMGTLVALNEAPDVRPTGAEIAQT